MKKRSAKLAFEQEVQLDDMLDALAGEEYQEEAPARKDPRRAAAAAAVGSAAEVGPARPATAIIADLQQQQQMWEKMI